MALRVDKLPAARLDLIEIWQYIAPESFTSADRLLGKIEERLDQIAEFPEMGRARPELKQNLRSLAVGKYVIFYTLRSKSIEVVRVIRGERDISAVRFD